MYLAIDNDERVSKVIGPNEQEVTIQEDSPAG